MVTPVRVEPTAFIDDEIAKSRAAIDELSRAEHVAVLADIARRIVASVRAGGKVVFCGNGGSAADSQHLATELVGRQNYHRAAVAAIALTVDGSALTAIANDYGYEQVFARQLEALGRAGDVLVAISTSGRSPSVIRAIETAQAMGITTVAFTGRDPRASGIADVVLAVPADDTAKIQELHITCGHVVLALVERTLFPEDAH